MSKSKQHFLAFLPLFAILSQAPIQVETQTISRSIASINDEEVKLSAHPKYETRAAKIERSKIEIDKDLDLSCFSDRGEALRQQLMSERKGYRVDVTDKVLVSQQKARIASLVSSLVDFEADFAVLKEKKAFEAFGEEIANKTINELKTTLESLLIDELENDFIVLKEQVDNDDEKPVLAVKEETQEDPKLCELEEKNAALSKQVEELLLQQKQIMETMLGMNHMMINMNQMQQPQQQYVIPSWLMSGSLVNPQLQYPYLPGQGSGSYVYYPEAYMPMVSGMSNQLQQPQGFLDQSQMGQQSLQQATQQYQNSLQNDPRYSVPVQMFPESFGQDPFQFNFGSSPRNQLPIQTA